MCDRSEKHQEVTEIFDFLCFCCLSVNFHRIKFLAIATEDKIEVYAWAPKPYHKFMAFKVSTLTVFQRPFNKI